MHYVIGIDVSKATSQVAVAIDGKVTQHFKITHDALEFNQLNTIIMQFNKFPDIVFEATGIYSRRLKSFLDWHNYPYTYLNPLAVLRSQENGNNIHELAFSIRGDWLVKNNLYDPEIRMIDQNKLKHAEQEVAKTLINKGFNLPLGEDENDVVWFGVIHQDTDHLNMHLWFAKKSQETRSEMVKQEGKYKGQPIGVIPLEVIEQAKRQFR
ncbi:relaxase MobL, partial [Leuconostoc gasicomitatum]